MNELLDALLDPLPADWMELGRLRAFLRREKAILRQAQRHTQRAERQKFENQITAIDSKLFVADERFRRLMGSA